MESCHHSILFLHFPCSVLDKKSKIKNLLKHFSKEFEDSKIICLDLKKFENSLNVVDTHGSFETNDKNLQLMSLEEQSLTEGHCEKKLINNGLCVIINQMYFEKEVMMIHI